MSITINGTTGIAGVDGTAATPSVQGADSNTGVFFPAADTVAVTTGGSERMRVDSSGNVGIGTSSPSSYGKLAALSADDNNTIVAVASNGLIRMKGYLASAASAVIEATNTVQSLYASLFVNGSTLLFGTGGTERMRIDSSGNVGIGTTSTGAKLDVSATGQTTARFTGTGGTYAGIANQTTYSSASVYSGVYYDIRNELGNAVANFLGDVNADGSSGWVWTTQPSGARTDRRVDAMRVSGTGLLQFNSGYGSVATAYGCRAWVNFNGTGTVAITASGNVTSITDNAVGDYTVNFTTAMPDANYAVNGMTTSNASSNNVPLAIYSTGAASTGSNTATTKTTSALRVRNAGANNTTQFDCPEISVAVYR